MTNNNSYFFKFQRYCFVYIIIPFIFRKGNHSYFAMWTLHQYFLLSLLCISLNLYTKSKSLLFLIRAFAPTLNTSHMYLKKSDFTIFIASLSLLSALRRISSASSLENSPFNALLTIARLTPNSFAMSLFFNFYKL